MSKNAKVAISPAIASSLWQPRRQLGLSKSNHKIYQGFTGLLPIEPLDKESFSKTPAQDISSTKAPVGSFRFTNLQRKLSYDGSKRPRRKLRGVPRAKPPSGLPIPSGDRVSLGAIRHTLPAPIISCHRRRLCAELLSCGHGLEAIAAQWKKLDEVVRLPLIAKYLIQTRRDRILLRFLQVRSSSNNLPGWWTDKSSCCKILIGCIDNLQSRIKDQSLSSRSAEARSGQIVKILNSMSRLSMGYGLGPLEIGLTRIRHLLQPSAPESISLLYDTLLLSKRKIPESVSLSFLHALANKGMFVRAIQIFQRVAPLPMSSQNSSLPRIWQFRRLFYKLYRSGVPIHQSDMLDFLSSLGYIDPLIYNLVIYTAATANDTSTVLRLCREYRTNTGKDITLDAVTSVFNMYRRLEDNDGLKRVYKEADVRELQPLKDSYFVTAVLLVEAHKPEATYWQLCNIYTHFFDTAPLNSLQLPLPISPDTYPQTAQFLQPTIGTLTIMLHSYLKTVCGILEGSKQALTIYERYVQLVRNLQMPQFRIADEHFLAILVAAVGKHRSHIGLALGIIQDMIDLDNLPTPTSVTWDYLLRVSAGNGDVITTERIWEAMLEHGISPTSHTYNSLMVLYRIAGMEEKFQALGQRMIDEGWDIVYGTK